MEHLIKIYLFFIICLFFCTILESKAQNTKDISINVQGTLYSQQKEESSNYIIYPVPEIEVLYRLMFYKKFSTHIGIKYSYNYWHKEVGVKSEWRQKAHELVVPIALEQLIGNYISLNGGAGIGYLMKGKKEYKNNIPANPKWEDITSQTNYDNEARIFFELFLSPRFKYDFDPYNRISIGPTLSYKIKDNWMKQIRPTTMFGISIQYSIKL